MKCFEEYVGEVAASLNGQEDEKLFYDGKCIGCIFENLGETWVKIDGAFPVDALMGEDKWGE